MQIYCTYIPHVMLCQFMSPSDYDVQSATAFHFDRVWFGSMLYLGFEVTLCLSSFHTPSSLKMMCFYSCTWCFHFKNEVEYEFKNTLLPKGAFILFVLRLRQYMPHLSNLYFRVCNSHVMFATSLYPGDFDENMSSLMLGIVVYMGRLVGVFL